MASEWEDDGDQTNFLWILPLKNGVIYRIVLVRAHCVLRTQ